MVFLFFLYIFSCSRYQRTQTHKRGVGCPKLPRYSQCHIISKLILSILSTPIKMPRVSSSCKARTWPLNKGSVGPCAAALGPHIPHSSGRSYSEVPRAPGSPTQGWGQWMRNRGFSKMCVKRISAGHCLPLKATSLAGFSSPIWRKLASCRTTA